MSSRARTCSPSELPPLLPQAFCAGDALQVAEALLGKELRRGALRLRIVEVEAYRLGDTASHARMGRTARNAPMWGPPGHAYVYLCYGIHSLLNIVTGAPGEPMAVLIRACEPIEGLSLLRARFPGRRDVELLSGPGRVARALGLDPSWSGHPLFEPGGLELRDGAPPRRIARGPRVGIDYARPEHREAPWRLADAESRWVTHRRRLRPAAPQQEPRRPSAP